MLWAALVLGIGNGIKDVLFLVPPLLRISLWRGQVINSLSQKNISQKWPGLGCLVCVFALSLGNCKVASLALILWPQMASFRNVLLSRVMTPVPMCSNHFD